jgi:uncharacterized protein
MTASFRHLGLLCALSSSILLTGCGPKVLHLSSGDGSKTATVTVEIADSPAERQNGLMNRSSLPQGTGMLFVFPEPQILTFWMKNTVIPLEILYFDAVGAFINAAQMVPCTGDPCQQYESQALAKYALEVNPQFRKENNIGVGWTVDPKAIGKISRPK